MADMSAAVVVSIIDQFSQNGAKFKATMKGMKRQVGEFSRGLKSGVKAELMPRFDVANFDRNLAMMEQRVSKARGRLLGAVGMAMAIAAPLKMSAGFDQTFKGLEKVLDNVPISRLKQLRKFALETSTLVPIASRELIELMAEASQGSVPLEELEKFSLYAAKAAIAFDMAGAKIGDSFAKLREVYHLNQQGIEDLGDATNHLSNNFAAKAKEIVNFTNRAAGAAAMLHLTAQETAAIGAALIASGIVPETAARGVNAFAARIEKGGKKVEEAFKLIGSSRKAFIEAVKEDGAKAFTDLFESLSKSEQGMRALIDLVGTDFADDFAKLLGNPELLKRALKSVEDQAKFTGSVIKEAASQAAGAEKQWELLVNKVNAVGVGMGDKLLPAALEIATGIGEMVTSFSQFSDANPEFVSAATNIAAGIMALSVASRVLGFVWASTGLKLFEGMSMFVKMDGGKNIAKFAPVMNGLKAVLVALPGPLKLVGLAALAAGAAFAYLRDDAKHLNEGIAEDPAGFDAYMDKLLGVKDAAEGADGALKQLNRTRLAAALVDKEKKLSDRTNEAVEQIEDAGDTTLFDLGDNDFSGDGKTQFQPALNELAQKTGDGTLSGDDVRGLQKRFDDHFSKRAGELSNLRQALAEETAKNEAKTFNFGSNRQRSLENDIATRLEEFERDEALATILMKRMGLVLKTREEIADIQAQLDEANRPKDAHDPALPAKPPVPGETPEIAVPEQAPVRVPVPQTSPKRDVAGRKKLLDNLNAIPDQPEQQTPDPIAQRVQPDQPVQPEQQIAVPLARPDIKSDAELDDMIAAANAQIRKLQGGQKSPDQATTASIEGVDNAVRDIEAAGAKSGQKLGSAAGQSLSGMAAQIGTQIGRAAAAEIKKASVNVNAPRAPRGKRGGAFDTSGALHDGVD